MDGILFHQILQVHNTLSAKLPPTSLVNVETNMVWDGFFHVLTWARTALGIAMLRHVAVERLGTSIYDYAFLLSGLIFLGLGWSLIKSGERAEPSGRQVPVES